MNKYDQQIAKLTENPNEIFSDWRYGVGLFNFLGRHTEEFNSGCLTQIRSDKESHKVIINGEVNEELTNKIHNDERIPYHAETITVKDLPVFKEYQELFDKLDPNR